MTKSFYLSQRSFLVVSALLAPSLLAQEEKVQPKATTSYAFALRADRPDRLAIAKRACGEGRLAELSTDSHKTHQVEAGISLQLSHKGMSEALGAYTMYQCLP